MPCLWVIKKLTVKSGPAKNRVPFCVSGCVLELCDDDAVVPLFIKIDNGRRDIVLGNIVLVPGRYTYIVDGGRAIIRVIVISMGRVVTWLDGR